ncbi:MAG: hypothetical protein IKY33_01550 [Clostridia bacterium]|nr:hypothetical protein [Clostridia bacterium]
MVSRNWTASEIEYLESKWGNVSIPYIAQKLDRSVNAVKEKAGRLGLGPVLMGGDYVTLNQLMIAVTGHTVDGYHKISWIQNRGLPVHTKRVNQCNFRVVYIDEFWKWAEENRSFIDFSKMEPLALGKEPAWVAEQRRKDHTAYGLQRKDPWSSVEDDRLIYLLKQQKYGYAELSAMLRRSAGAIQRRCTDLGIKYRPIKADNHGEAAKWTEEHFRILAVGIRHGDSYTVIGNKIGKSEKAIRGKVYSVYLTENADKIRSMLQNGEWGSGAPIPMVKQGLALSRYRRETKEQLAYLAGLLRYRANQMGYDPYWQRFMCMHWDDFDGCTVGETDCDSCTQFCRIREQYCARCGKTFFEREDQQFCKECRIARKKQAQKKWRILSKKNY